MKKLIAYAVLAGAVGMLLGIVEIVTGREIGGTVFIVGAVLCFGGELVLKHTR